MLKKAMKKKPPKKQEKIKKSKSRKSSNKTTTLIKKVNLAVMAVIIVGFILYGANIAYQSIGELSIMMKNEAEQKIHSISTEMDDFLEEFGFLLKIVGNEEIVVDFMKEANGLEKTLHILEISEYNKTISTLRNIKADLKDAEGIYLVVDSNKAMIYDNGLDYKGSSTINEEWYNTTVNNEDVTIYGPHFSEKFNDDVITVSKPIYDRRQLVGIIAVDISLEVLAKKYERYESDINDVMILNGEEVVYATEEALADLEYIEQSEDFKNLMANINLEESNDDDNANIVTVDGRTVLMENSELTGWTIIVNYYVDIVAEKLISIGITLAITLVVFIIISNFVIYLVLKRILKDLPAVNNVIQQTAQGDLTHVIEVKSRDEIGQIAMNLNDMSASLSTFVKEVKNTNKSVYGTSDLLSATTNEVSMSSEEITKTVEQIAAGMNDQADSVDQCVQIVNALGVKINNLYENSNASIGHMDNMVETSDSGAKAVGELRTATDYNNNAIETIENSVNGLDNQTRAISDILNTITAIADQTNLLALNASIEAARAGEYGRGFAVVADEIRNLAEGTTNAAKEIGGMLTNIQGDTKEIVTDMTDVKDTATLQTKAVELVASAFEEINKVIEQISIQFNSTNKIANELNTDKDSIIATMEEVSAVSEETAAASEEINATMEEQLAAINELVAEANNLKKEVSSLDEKLGFFKAD